MGWGINTEEVQRIQSNDRAQRSGMESRAIIVEGGLEEQVDNVQTEGTACGFSQCHHSLVMAFESMGMPVGGSGWTLDPVLAGGRAMHR